MNVVKKILAMALGLFAALCCMAPATRAESTSTASANKITATEVSAPAGPAYTLVPRDPRWYSMHDTDLYGRVRERKVISVTAAEAVYLADKNTDTDAFTLISETETEAEANVSEATYEEARPAYVVMEDGSVFYYDLDWVKENLTRWYTDEEIRQTTLIIQAEDLIANSDTIWSAHAWCILDRVGAPGFSGNSSIIGILSAPRQFVTYCPYNLSRPMDDRVESIVRDVFARAILERYGASEEMVGRTLQPEYHYFRAGGGIYNRFWTSWSGGYEYNPFAAPYNPYTN